MNLYRTIGFGAIAMIGICSFVIGTEIFSGTTTAKAADQTVTMTTTGIVMAQVVRPTVTRIVDTFPRSTRPTIIRPTVIRPTIIRPSR